MQNLDNIASIWKIKNYKTYYHFKYIYSTIP